MKILHIVGGSKKGGAFKGAYILHKTLQTLNIDSQIINDEIIKEGIYDVLTSSGFEIREPGCSACLAMNEDKIPSGKYVVSTSNRNFEGRQGPGARTILASPIVAAAAAITGKITDPRIF